MWLSYWWCDHCGVEVPKEHATVAFTHALAGGGCGKPLTERFNSAEPPEDDSLTRLTAERDAAIAEVARLDAEVERCHERLEMTHRYRCVNPETGETARVDIPRAERSFAYDGIDCRDETIRLQDQAVDELRAENARLREAVKDMQSECSRCLVVQGVPAAETPTTHGYGKIFDIAARALVEPAP